MSVNTTQKPATSLEELYTRNTAVPAHNVAWLLTGHSGSGKTTMATTGLEPVFFDFFDPQGPASVQAALKAGRRIVYDDRWTRFDPDDPTLIGEWAREHARRRATPGFWEGVGTYVIDSWTMLEYAQRVAFEAELAQSGETLSGFRWGDMGRPLISRISALLSLPCDVVLITHLKNVAVRPKGALVEPPPIWRLAATGQLVTQLQVRFCERYVLAPIEMSVPDPKQSGKTIQTKQYKVLTQAMGGYDAITRIGGGAFNTYEPANIKELRRKAGYATADKPHDAGKSAVDGKG